MIKKSDIVREAVLDQDWKKALQIAKGFRIGVTQEQRSRMAKAYECIVHPDFYRQIGTDIPEAIEQGKAIVKKYAESIRRKNTMMKWDVKHDMAKRVIDTFLEAADIWQKTGEFVVPKREDMTGSLTEDEKALVSGEVAMMIASIRKRYKLQERLAEQEAQIRQEEAETVIPAEQAEKTSPEPANEAGEQEKAKERRKSCIRKKAESTGEKKERKPREKKVKEAEA